MLPNIIIKVMKTKDKEKNLKKRENQCVTYKRTKI